MSQLNIGDMAPAFAAPDQNNNIINLESFRGSKLILYFYPKDNTPGCTLEAKNLRDGKAELASKGFRIVGVSPDSVRSHHNFCDKHELNFTLLADPEKTIANAYGVWGEKKFMGRTVVGIRRTTFVIDENGMIERIFEKVDTKNHWHQILESYK